MLTANVVCLNEISYIESCIKTLDFCDEIIVIDGGSEDGTWEKLVELSRANHKLYPIISYWGGDYGAQRQIALGLTEPGSWVLKWDCDEIASTPMREQLKTILDNSVYGAYSVRIFHLVQDRLHYSAAYPESHIRLFKKGPGVEWHGSIHEQIGYQQPLGAMPEEICCIHLSFLDLARLRRKGEHYSKIPGSGFSCWQDLVYRNYAPAPLPENIKYEADVEWLDELASRRAE